MKIVILAAGKGSRLGDLNSPKPLTLLSNGKSILQMQLDAISNYASLENVIVIVGFHKEMIIEKFAGLHYVENHNFANENTAKSLLRAVKTIQEEDLIWINGDVVFHPAVFKAAFQSKRNGMVVNVGNVGQEEVKYRTDGKGRILQVSKEVEKAEGEALGINKFLGESVPLFQKSLERCNEKDYFEKGVEYCIQEGAEVRSIPVEANWCVEVDFPQDLVRANEIIGSWK